MILNAAYATDTGRVRSVNQDRSLVVPGRLYAVADGMGGHRGGEIAAQLAVDALSAQLGGTGPIASPDHLVDAIQFANGRIHEQSSVGHDLAGMGTTVTAIAVCEPGDGASGRVGASLAVANVGDSRAYLLRAGELTQLTDDHSVVAELLRDGRISEQEAKVHPRRSMLTRALGVESRVTADLLEVLASTDDRYLLCSDGLYGEVDDDVIGSVLRRLADPQEAARELVSMALKRGGRDNVTVVIVDVLDDDDLAVKASASLDRTAVLASPTAADKVDPTSAGRGGSAPVRAPAPARRGAPATTATGTSIASPTPAAAARPRLVSLRTLLFLLLLGGVAAFGIWAVTNDPGRDEPKIKGNTGTLTGATTTPLLPTTTEDPFALDPELPTAPTTAGPASAPGPAAVPGPATAPGPATVPVPAPVSAPAPASVPAVTTTPATSASITPNTTTPNTAPANTAPANTAPANTATASTRP